MAIGKGSKDHQRYQQYLCDKAQKDNTIAVIEGYLNGKFVDVLVYDFSRDFITGYEIQMSTKTAVTNAIADLNAGCDEVVIVSPDEIIMEKIKKLITKKIPKPLLKKIKFHILTQTIQNNRK